MKPTNFMRRYTSKFFGQANRRASERTERPKNRIVDTEEILEILEPELDRTDALLDASRAARLVANAVERARVIPAPSVTPVLPTAWGKYAVLLGTLCFGVAGAIYSYQTAEELPNSRGETERPHRILIASPGDDALVNWVNQQALTSGDYEFRRNHYEVPFEAQRMGFHDLVRQGRTLDDELDGIQAVLEYADEIGFGYVALPLRGIEQESILQSLENFGLDIEVPIDAQWAVLNVGSLRRPFAIHFGSPVPGFEFSETSAKRASLMHALFQHETLYRLNRSFSLSDNRTISLADAYTPEIPDANLRYGGVLFARSLWRPLNFGSLIHQTMERWSEIEPQDTSEFLIARPFERVSAAALANGGILVGSQQLVWRSHEASRARLAVSPHDDGYALTYLPNFASLSNRQPACHGLPVDKIRAFRVSPRGDAVEVRNSNGTHSVYALTSQDTWHCQFELVSESPAGDEPLSFGTPHKSGITAWILSQSEAYELAWRRDSVQGNYVLRDRKFSGIWDWEPTGSLLAVTVDPRTFAQRIERLTTDAMAIQGFHREVLVDLEALRDSMDADGNVAATSTVDTLYFHAGTGPFHDQVLFRLAADNADAKSRVFSILHPFSERNRKITEIEINTDKYEAAVDLLDPTRNAPKLQNRSIAGFGASLLQTTIQIDTSNR